MQEKVSAIIVAAGKGIRMNASTRKQYLLLGRTPIIVRSVRLYSGCPAVTTIFLVVPPSDKNYCEGLIDQSSDLGKTCHVISGGDTRQASVYQGLLAVEKAGLVGGIVVIHDGVRPFVNPDQVESCIASARTTGACILAVPVHDTLKQMEKGTTVISGTLPRKDIWFAQTPQAFRYELIRNAHERALKERVSGTDDAMLVERIGIPVSVVPGSRRNIKITTPEDLALAEALLASETIV